MPLRIGSDFLDFLSFHDPLAMALLARGIAMLKLVEYAWWVHGGGEYKVMTYDIHGICELMPSNCSWTMEWPLKLVSGEIGPDTLPYIADSFFKHGTRPTILPYM